MGKAMEMIQTFYRRVRDESRIPWYIFYAGLTVELLMVIVDKSECPVPYEGYLFRLTFLLFAMKLALTKYSKKQWLLIVFLEAVGFLSYRVTGKNDVIRIVTFIVACKDIPLKQMIKYAFYVTLAGCVAIVMLSVTGIYGEMTLTQDFGRGDEMSAYAIGEGYVETRYTLGMGHPNALACMFLMLVSMGIYVYGEKLKWYGSLFLMLLGVFVYWLSDSATSLLITGVLVVGACVMHYCKFLRENRLMYVCGLLVFVMSIAFSVDAAANAQRVREATWNSYYYRDPRDTKHIVALMHIDHKINNRIRSLTNSENNDGTLETWSLFSSPNNMNYYFDMGWVKLFYRYGIIPGIIYCIAYIWLLWALYRKRDAYGLVVFVVLTVYTIVEAHLFSVYIGRNFLFMMIGGYMSMPGKKEEA